MKLKIRNEEEEKEEILEIFLKRDPDNDNNVCVKSLKDGSEKWEFVFEDNGNWKKCEGGHLINKE